MNIKSRIKRLERRAGGSADDRRVAVDFGSWLGVVRVPPKTLSDLEKIYGKHGAEQRMVQRPTR